MDYLIMFFQFYILVGVCVAVWITEDVLSDPDYNSTGAFAIGIMAGIIWPAVIWSMFIE